MTIRITSTSFAFAPKILPENIIYYENLVNLNFITALKWNSYVRKGWNYQFLKSRFKIPYILGGFKSCSSRVGVIIMH